jgi:hypothetical protein
MAGSNAPFLRPYKQPQVVAQLMDHANVDTTLNVYTQVLDDSMRDAVETGCQESFALVQSPGETVTLFH